MHTVPEFRGHGFAPQLIEWVERDQQEQGVALSLLYSDIAPAYYERLGYFVCPGWEAEIVTASAFATARELLQSSPKVELEKISRFEKRETLARIYDNHHASMEISIDRDETYWDFLLAKQPEDEFYLLNESSGNPAAYVRLQADSERLLIRDFALARNDVAGWNGLLARIVCVAADRNLPAVGGWLPNLSALPSFAKLSRRDQEITMLKPLDASLVIDESVREAAQHFVEIDHV